MSDKSQDPTLADLIRLLAIFTAFTNAMYGKTVNRKPDFSQAYKKSPYYEESTTVDGEVVRQETLCLPSPTASPDES